MSAWTNGKMHVFVGPAGLSVHRGERVELVLSTEQLGGPLPTKKSKGAVARVHPLAVTADGKFAYTIDAERKLIRTALEPGGPANKFPWEISDLAPGEGQRVFAAFVSGTKARALTSIAIGVPPADPKGKWEHEFEADRASKVEWPDGLLWERAQWSRKTRWTIDPALLHIDANAHGYAVYDLDSAVIGVLRRPAPNALPTGFNAVLRTPKQKGTTLAATLSARGMLVAISKPDGAALIGEFDNDGKLLHHRKLEATAIGPITHAGERVFVLIEHRKLMILGLDLSTQAELDLQLPPSQVRLQASGDGSSFLLGLANQVFEGKLGADGWSVREHGFTDVPAPGKAHEAAIAEAPIEVPEEPVGANGKADNGRTRIITQAPRLDLDPNQPNEAWQFVIGEPFEIVLNAVSVGGPAETGLFVEISGAALDKGLVEPELAAIEGQTHGQASFERHGKKRIATFPELLVPAGVEPIRDKKVKPKERFLENPEDTFLTIRLRGQVGKLGSGELLFVRVGFERVGQEGSLMRGRPISVFATRPQPPPKPEPEPAPEPAAQPAAQPEASAEPALD